MYTIEQIEDAIIAALAPLKVGYAAEEGDPAIYGTIRTIKSYQSELDTEEELARAVRLFPALLVMYGGSVYGEHGGRKIETMAYIIFACDRNLRAEAEARRGGSGNPGTYAMLNGVRDLLAGKQLGLNIYPLKPIREAAEFKVGAVSIYSAEYETAQALLYPGA